MNYVQLFFEKCQKEYKKTPELKLVDFAGPTDWICVYPDGEAVTCGGLKNKQEAAKKFYEHRFGQIIETDDSLKLLAQILGSKMVPTGGTYKFSKEGRFKKLVDKLKELGYKTEFKYANNET